MYNSYTPLHEHRKNHKNGNMKFAWHHSKQLISFDTARYTTNVYD